MFKILLYSKARVSEVDVGLWVVQAEVFPALSPCCSPGAAA